MELAKEVIPQVKVDYWKKQNIFIQTYKNGGFREILKSKTRPTGVSPRFYESSSNRAEVDESDSNSVLLRSSVQDREQSSWARRS